MYTLKMDRKNEQESNFVDYNWNVKYLCWAHRRLCDIFLSFLFCRCIFVCAYCSCSASFVWIYVRQHMACDCRVSSLVYEWPRVAYQTGPLAHSTRHAQTQTYSPHRHIQFSLLFLLLCVFPFFDFQLVMRRMNFTKWILQNDSGRLRPYRRFQMVEWINNWCARQSLFSTLTSKWMRNLKKQV